MKVALVTQGRFHAIELMGGLVERGHEVTLLSGHPEAALRRAGLQNGRVRTFGLHGGAAYATRRVGWPALRQATEGLLHRAFGRWAARQVGAESWDAVYAWSSVAEELLRAPRPDGQVRMVERGSSHVLTQRRLLDEETARVGVPLERPSDWMLAREQREYALADGVAVLSTFARQSFIDHGADPSRIWLLRPGVDVQAFRPSEIALADRSARIRSGAPLRVLFAGTLSFRKGLWDLAAIVRDADRQRMTFTLVGDVPAEAASAVAGIPGDVRVLPRQPQARLKDLFAEADVFLFPTIEDGFALVLAQAHAAGLPVLTTPNGAGSDLLDEGRTGWILPIRDPGAFSDRLRWCDEHRTELASLVEGITGGVAPRPWAAMAADLEAAVETTRHRLSLRKDDARGD